MAGQVQIEQDLLDRHLYMWEQVPADRGEGLEIHNIVLLDNEYIQDGSRAFNGNNPNPVIYEAGIVLGHKNSGNCIRYSLLSDPTCDGLHATLQHVATCLLEFRRKDYRPAVGKEVRFVGGYDESNTYRGQMFGHVMQLQMMGEGANAIDCYYIHRRDGRASTHTREEFRTVAEVVYVCMRGAWD